MTPIENKGRQLNEVQQQQQRNRVNLRAAKETLAKNRLAQQRLARYFDPQNSEHQARQRQLLEQSTTLQGSIRRLESRFVETTGLLEGLIADFEPFTDPRENLSSKHTDYPFLLFPLRLETRFKSVSVVGADTVEQLWVRVYPDECLVDTFESIPSESELLSTQKFWVDWLKAGGVEAEQQGAWRSLVSGFGAGRAAWLIEQYTPDAGTSFPSKEEFDVILAIATEQPLAEAEKTVVESFWISMWRADGELAATQSAYSTLEQSVGAERAGVIRDRYAPINLSEPPPPTISRAEASVTVAFLDFPSLEQTDTQRQPWSQAPRINTLPERLVLLGYRNGEKVLEQLGNPIPTPLIAGPDPLAEGDDQIRSENGEVIVSDAMRWMTDFDRAVEVGMGFRVTLARGDSRRGFDQLLVLGARLSADPPAGQSLVETLFEHHQTGTTGFSLLPQGTPTNNTEGASSGFSESEDADETYDLVFNAEPLSYEADWRSRSDGQWLAELLGIRRSTFEKTLHARGRDQCEARAMNTALWPGTCGYLMETMMSPVFSDLTIEQTRWFFNSFVSARGILPAIRIGDQPYGILPTTVFSRIIWLRDKQLRRPQGISYPPGYRDYLGDLHRLLSRMRGDWQTMSEEASYVGKSGDPHQILLDIVGLHASSAEYYQRYAESLEQLTNRLKLQGFWGQLLAALIALGYPKSGMDLLSRLGYEAEDIPEVLEKFFLKRPDKLTGDLIDDQPLSESNPIRAYTDDERNYIRWLIDSARTSFDTLRKEEGFADEKPRALLYLMLRYALEQGYWDAGLRLFQSFELLTPVQLATARLDPSFIHVGDRTTDSPTNPTTNSLNTSGKPLRLNQRSESRYEYLYQTASTITNTPDMVIADYIPQVISQLPATRYLYQQIEALEHLEQTPTARLERLLAEHVDLCTYRLDAWRWGLLNYQLMGMRYGDRPDDDDDVVVVEIDTGGEGGEGGENGDDNESPARQGVYLGAFGILEQVKSENKQLTPVDDLDEELGEIFNPSDNPDLPPLMRDSTNGGYVHAPSLNHAIAAAILRNGYLENADPDNPELLKVNLSSERSRMALSIIEGIRSGQTLGALLGYQLERGLHDRHNQAEVDEFILDLRKAFPLVANRFRRTQTEPDDRIETVEARNVINGYALVNQIKSTDTNTYPFGKDSLPDTITDDQRAAINAEVARILDIHDAISDVVIAEGVYQAVQGNYGRVASNLNAYAKGTFPPEPEVLQTPRSGTNLTHRMGLHLQPGLNPAVSPNALAVTPRAYAEPAVNSWLNQLLPDPSTVICKATYFDSNSNSLQTIEVSQQQLNLQSADLLYLVDLATNQSMTELDDRIVYWVITTQRFRWDIDIEIQYIFKEAGKVSFFELGALLGSLRSLILKSRPLNAADVALPTEAQQERTEQVFLDPARLNPLVAQIGELVSNPAADDLDTLLAEMASWLDDLETHSGDVINAIDDWMDRIMALFMQVMAFGIAQAGIGFAYSWKKQQIATLIGRVSELISRWQEQISLFETLITVDYPVATTDEERFAILRQAESFVSTEITVPLPETPAAYLTAVQAKRATFAAQLTQFQAIQESPSPSLSQLLVDIQALFPLTEFDAVGLEVTDIEAEILRFAADLQTRVTLLRTEIVEKQDKAAAQISEALEKTASDQVEGLTLAAKTLLGEDFKMVPEFTLSEEQGSEWGNAWGDRAQLLTYLTTPEPTGADLDFPIDEWLYGLARVREDAHHWEKVTLLTRAFGTGEPELTPIQLPFRENDSWLALPYPTDYALEGDRLLYTAHYAVPFNPNANQCGLLLDEWTEVIPTPEETTGITFNYDQPNSEPPQTLLLVTSPQMNGEWRWNDLVDAVRETFEEARLRAVEPTQIDKTDYARFLPATLSAVTFHPITIMLNLALNNNVYSLIDTEENA
ncbi:MAG: hypothetical protein AAGB19_02440 [Cyanobacteria bacterium P01_F01_bin.3]